MPTPTSPLTPTGEIERAVANAKKQVPLLTDKMAAEIVAEINAVELPQDRSPLTVVERAVTDAEITIVNLRAIKRKVNAALDNLERAAQQYKKETRTCMDTIYAVLTRKDH